MTIAFNRRDIGYTIISRFEEAYRLFLAKKLSDLFGHYEEGIPNGILAKAKDRALEDNWDGVDDLLEHTDFPDLKEICCYDSMYESYFPHSDLGQKEFVSLMDELYNLRCKIAHVRQYFTSLDLDRLSEHTRTIAADLGRHGKDFHDFIRKLDENPEHIVIPTPIEFCDSFPGISSIPNNIPIPDYEYEGGFVGRNEDIHKVINLLKSRRDVITISGAGGVGKTALALRIIQHILEKNDPVFDGIVWLSAKEAQLTYLGIEEIEPTLKNYEELLDTVFEVMGFGDPRDSLEQKEADTNTIFDLHDCILIVIDNLETITDERIIDFILDPHPNIKILITSRRGLGQVERRHELRQLKEKEAIHLFRQISRDKNIENLAQLDNGVIRDYVKKVSCYPLSIKWVIGQVAIGRDINVVIDEIIETTSDISRFCFDQIYSSLSQPAKRTLCTLSAFDEPPAAGVLSYVANLDKENFEDGLRELILVSLVIPEPRRDEQQNISTRYGLLPLTRGYVRQQLDEEPTLRRQILERLEKVQTTVEEAERAKKQYRYSLANLGATTEEEKVAAMMAQNAFQKYQAGRYAEAVEDYKRAIGIAPRFASLYRNWAFMEAQEQHHVEADRLLEKASRLNPNDTQIWLTWGNMKRKQGKIKDSLSKYNKAYELSPNDSIVLNALGQAKSRLGDYERAHRLFTTALQKVVGDSKQNEIINRSSIAHNLRRWAEDDRNDRKYSEAKEKLEEALNHCQVTIALDKTDRRSLDLQRRVLIDLGYLHVQMGKLQSAVDFFSRAIVDKPPHRLRFREAKDSVVAATQAGKILYYEFGHVDEARRVFSKSLKEIRDPLRSNSSLRSDFQDLWQELYRKESGKIVRISVNRGFAIIQSISDPEITHFGHITNFEPEPPNLSKTLMGKRVRYIQTERETDTGTRKEAISIRIVDK